MHNDSVEVLELDRSERSLITEIANWYFEEWNTPIYKTIDRLSSKPGNESHSQVIVKVNGEMVATGGLSSRVNILAVHPDLDKCHPWIALLFTKEEFRNKGYGSLMMSYLEEQAKNLGYQHIYLYTFTAESLYQKLSYKEIARVNYKQHDTAVMVKTLRQ